MQLLEKLADRWPQSQVPLRGFPLVGDPRYSGRRGLPAAARENGFLFCGAHQVQPGQLPPWLNDDLRHRTATTSGIRPYLDKHRPKSLEIALEGGDIAFQSRIHLDNRGGLSRN